MARVNAASRYALSMLRPLDLVRILCPGREGAAGDDRQLLPLPVSAECPFTLDELLAVDGRAATGCDLKSHPFTDGVFPSSKRGGTMARQKLVEILAATIISMVRTDGRDLTSRQLAVLLLCETPEPPRTVRALAAMLNIPKPAITRAYDHLEEMDLAERLPEPGDRRSVIGRLTPGGHAYVAKLRSALAAAAERSTDRIDDGDTAHPTAPGGR